MVFLPEAADYIANSSDQSREFAEPIDGPTVTQYQTLAKDCELWISLGGFHIKVIVIIYVCVCTCMSSLSKWI